MELSATDGLETSILRAPAWNATLSGIAIDIAEQFEQDRRNFGGFTLILQTPLWEFATQIGDHTVIDVVRPRVFPLPSHATLP